MPYCIRCGKEITGKHKNRNKYCSVECYNAAEGRTAKHFKTATCFLCGKEFDEKRDRTNNFCSKSCAAIHRAKLNAIEEMERDKKNPDTIREIEATVRKLDELTERLKHERQCKYCGKWFLTTDTGKRSFCSDECAKKADNRCHDRRLYRNGRPDLTISLPRLFDRDRGICAICGRVLTFDCDTNSDEYPSIDHIKPLNKGGLHRWDNVQLTCRRCNTLKSDEWDEG